MTVYVVTGLGPVKVFQEYHKAVEFVQAAQWTGHYNLVQIHATEIIT